MKKLVIWDLDGTLFDTTRAMQFCGNFALKKLGLPTFPRRRYAAFSGGGVEGYVGAILDAAGDREHRLFDDFWRLYLEGQESLPADANRVYAGVRTVLGRCQKDGVHLAVLSNKDETTCRAVVTASFGAAFDLILGNAPPRPPKPDPVGVREILAHFGVHERECLYVGDTEVDLITASNAGVDAAAALWGYRTREDLLPYRPAFFAEKPADLLLFLNR